MRNPAGGRGGLHQLLRRRSIIAFLLTLPLIVLLGVLLVYPTGFAVYLSMLNRDMNRFIGLDNFAFLFGRASFWRVLWQTCFFAIAAAIFKSTLGFAAAHLVHNIPRKGQRKWRGMLLVPWVVPVALSTLAWRWLLDPSHSAFNWILQHLGMDRIFWLGEPGWARFSVIMVNVWFGAPFFMIMYLASLKSVPEELYEAAAIDGASWGQRLRYITLPMMRHVIAITLLFSLIGGFTGFDIVAVLTNGGPLGTTHVLATSSFLVGLISGNLPLASAMSLFMLPVLIVAASYVLLGIAKRGSQV
ncbi:MAG TPA: sugar ABC transporter permease [Reyranella sp.]|nr:sugar ABC transporter permease [Reyranella sp.]